MAARRPIRSPLQPRPQRQRPSGSDGIPQESGLPKRMSVVILLTVVPFNRRKMRGKRCQLSDNNWFEKSGGFLNDSNLIFRWVMCIIIINSECKCVLYLRVVASSSLGFS